MINQFNRLIAPYLRMIRMTASRGVVKKVNDNKKMQEMQVSILKDELYSDIERFQDYGFTSVPQKDAETLHLSLGGNRDHTVIIKADDRRYRLTNLQNGEVALYTDEGDKIHFQRGKIIEIFSGNKLVINIENEIDVTTKKTTVNSEDEINTTTKKEKKTTSESYELDSDETVKISGSTSVTIDSDNDIIINCDNVTLNSGTKIELGGSEGTMRKLIDERLIELFNGHGHPPLNAPPTTQLSLDNTATTITKAG